MGPKKGRRNLKRPKTAEVAKRPNGPADSLNNPEAAPTEAQSSISGTTGSNEPFPGAGHRLGEGRGHSQSLPVHRWRYSVRPAASYLLFPQTQIKWPRISEGTQPVDRKPLVYHMDARGEQNTDAGEEDLPEDFFQVTAEDIKKRYAQLQTDRRALDEAPLLTSALREDNVIKQMQRYPKVVIRVCFPDRHVLQGLFRPLETVGNLKQFVRNHLVDPQIQFSLCGAPGTLRMDDPGATLYEANLFPTALLYFSSGSQSGGKNLQIQHCGQRGITFSPVHFTLFHGSFLHPCHLSSTVSVAEANAATKSCEPRSHTSSHTSLVPEGSFPLPAAPEASTNQQRPAADSWRPQKISSRPTRQCSDPPTGTRPRPVGTADRRIPKWLKLPGKK
ncbi:tether containing UBX domain for GLUT4-like isoform X1 [Alosa alosa]|uniref:tether containing UBX domain for GLUT4-like isoform X1 n=1 Tax=Alosa alosa TaxID=278164 RepID=UPI0020153310|nr:tether containing UBX domain for GLUT4-like isoform X1 [Alosa alosa]